MLSQKRVNDSVYAVAPGVYCCLRAKGRAYLFKERAKSFFEIDGATLVFWSQFDGRRSLQEIADDLNAKGYKVEQSGVHFIWETCRQLKRKGYLIAF